MCAHQTRTPFSDRHAKAFRASPTMHQTLLPQTKHYCHNHIRTHSANITFRGCVSKDMKWKYLHRRYLHSRPQKEPGMIICVHTHCCPTRPSKPTDSLEKNAQINGRVWTVGSLREAGGKYKVSKVALPLAPSALDVAGECASSLLVRL